MSPYFIDCNSIFSPIEDVVWQYIRGIGGIILYPQFPLFNYFIDFANPYLRIGLEMDGKEFHDIEKDKIRDEKLFEYGWKIFRISGKECYSKIERPDDDDPEYIENIHKWFSETCEGVFYALKEVFFNKYSDKEDIFYTESILTLKKHSLVDYNL